MLFTKHWYYHILSSWPSSEVPFCKLRSMRRYTLYVTCKKEYLFTNSPHQGICPAYIQLFKILAELTCSSHPDYFLGVPKCRALAACFHWFAKCCAGTVCIHCFALVMCNHRCCRVRKLWRMVSQYARKQQLFHRLHGIHHLAWSLCLVISTCLDHCRSREHFWSNEMQPKVCSWVQTLNPYFLNVGIRCVVSLGQISQLSGKYV